MGEDREHLVLYTKEYMLSHPDVDYFVYGHRHIELDLMLTAQKRMMILGDWISQFTYAVFDGDHLLLQEYVEGETKF
jgi:UDP-2,3-diacylglucosamine hydrolase